jgi:hypothetical protein
MILLSSKEPVANSSIGAENFLASTGAAMYCTFVVLSPFFAPS